MRPPRNGAVHTCARFASAAIRRAGAPLPTTIVVSAANSSLTTFAFNGVRACESRTMRRSLEVWILVFGVSRTVKLGSSASTVFTPTRIASAPARSLIPSARASSPVIHLDSPDAVAIFPSSVIAAFTVTNGVR